MKRVTAVLFLCLALALHADDGGNEENVLVIQGKPNSESLTTGDQFPSLEGRYKELRPWTLPKGIRYKFAEDSAVQAAAESITQHLLAGKKSEKPFFSDSVFVNAGAWKLLKSRLAPLKTSGPTMTNLVPLGSKVIKLEMALLQNKEDALKLEQILVEIVKHDGGGQVRALQTLEMKKWWTFIAFDITEPTLVLETKNNAHRFILSLGEDGLVSSVDELNGLPD